MGLGGKWWDCGTIGGQIAFHEKHLTPSMGWLPVGGVGWAGHAPWLLVPVSSSHFRGIEHTSRPNI